ncbi:TIGR03773 family transporter-associated surface protein [Kibdelosporangium aridum]|uniref:TIGR03773 family transporter-associated surface protein n=1 Tax=Kibdelosporangium aridum TaxID=2030 RepID=UPI000691C673|nr:TIGR03773 family transporter-associated surface protein [Kibdelosporangium aridum]
MIRRLAVLTLALLALLAPVAVGQTRKVVADGHIDMGPRFVDGKWTVQIRDDTVSPAVWRDLSDVVVQVPDVAKTQIPTDPVYGFLGQAGSPVWLLPQVQRPGVVWPGWNTQDPEVVAKVGKEVTWRLAGVRGPGTFKLFVSGNFGAPEVIFDSAKPYPQETGVESNTHVHGNWAFSAPGTYLLDVEMTGTANDGKALADRRTLRMHVGDERPESAFDIPATSSAPSLQEKPAAESTPVAQPVEAQANPWVWVAGAVGVLGLVVVLLVLRRRARG